MSALPRPDLPPGPAQRLVEELHALHHRAGWPSLRTMAREVGCSHTTVSAAFSDARVPRWGLLELLVETLDGDTEEFHRLWLAATGETSPDAGAAPPDEAVPAAARRRPRSAAVPRPSSRRWASPPRAARPRAIPAGQNRLRRLGD